MLYARTDPLPLLTFTGSELELNYATSAAGQALPGFALDDCEPTWGDHISRIVKWKTTPDLAAPAGKPVRLRFETSDADVFSIRFQ